MATDAMPISLHVRMTRHAISPRLATRILSAKQHKYPLYGCTDHSEAPWRAYLVEGVARAACTSVRRGSEGPGRPVPEERKVAR